jgi:predicted ATPase
MRREEHAGLTARNDDVRLTLGDDVWQQPRLSTVRAAVNALVTSYPFDVPAIATFDSLEVRSRVLFLVGENGSGKSTFLEALAQACGFGPEGGSRNIAFSTRPQSDRDNGITEEGMVALANALRLTWRKKQRDGFFLRAESFFNVASHLERSGLLESYGGRSLHTRSHGESFLALFAERFGGNGLYLLDEPEAALSPARQLALLVRMHDLLAGDAHSQFVIATHSPIILAFPEAQIVSFDGPALREIAYEQCDAYAITKRFLSDPQRMLSTLFEET